MTAQPVEQQTPEVWGALSVFAYVPSVPGPALRVLLFLLGVQEPGGRIVIKQQDVAQALGMKRQGGRPQPAAPAVRPDGVQGPERRLRAAPADRRVHHTRRAGPGRGGLAPEDLLDVDDFEERYQQAVEAHQQELKRKAQERQQAPRPAADLAAHRRPAGTVAAPETRGPPQQRGPRRVWLSERSLPASAAMPRCEAPAITGTAGRGVGDYDVITYAPSQVHAAAGDPVPSGRGPVPIRASHGRDPYGSCNRLASGRCPMSELFDAVDALVASRSPLPPPEERRGCAPRTG